MRDYLINITIAAHLGWNFNPSECKGWVYPDVWCRNPEGKLQFRHSIPDFCRDLNAMHEAEKTLNMDKEHQYGEWLRIASQNVGPRGGHFIPNGFGCFALAHLSARQRAEAFLRTLGKWKEAA